ncbi:unnamed protein product, partial [Mesorhabditis spiculigera]
MNTTQRSDDTDHLPNPEDLLPSTSSPEFRVHDVNVVIPSDKPHQTNPPEPQKILSTTQDDPIQLTDDNTTPADDAQIPFPASARSIRIDTLDNGGNVLGHAPIPGPCPGPGSPKAEPILGRLLLFFTELKMHNPSRHREAVERLRQLEEELRESGAVCPPDPAVADAVARALAAAAPGHDIQIRVNQSRHTTTTKTVYETETPGMVGLSPDHIRSLHRQMLDSLVTGNGSDAHAESGTTQKKETAEEGFTDEDGALVVSKRMTRLVTTTRSALPGEAEPAPDSPVESMGSVKDRIAAFESIARDQPPTPPRDEQAGHAPVAAPRRTSAATHETSEEEVEEEDEHGNVRKVIRKKRITEKYTRTEFHIPRREGDAEEEPEVEQYRRTASELSGGEHRPAAASRQESEISRRASEAERRLSEDQQQLSPASRQASEASRRASEAEHQPFPVPASRQDSEASRRASQAEGRLSEAEHQPLPASRQASEASRRASEAETPASRASTQLSETRPESPEDEHLRRSMAESHASQYSEKSRPSDAKPESPELSRRTSASKAESWVSEEKETEKPEFTGVEPAEVHARRPSVEEATKSVEEVVAQASAPIESSEEEVEEEDEHGNVRRVIRKKRIMEKYTRTEFHIPRREGEAEDEPEAVTRPESVEQHARTESENEGEHRPTPASRQDSEASRRAHEAEHHLSEDEHRPSPAPASRQASEASRRASEAESHTSGTHAPEAETQKERRDSEASSRDQKLVEHPHHLEDVQEKPDRPAELSYTAEAPKDIETPMLEASPETQQYEDEIKKAEIRTTPPSAHSPIGSSEEEVEEEDEHGNIRRVRRHIKETHTRTEYHIESREEPAEHLEEVQDHSKAAELHRHEEPLAVETDEPVKTAELRSTPPGKRSPIDSDEEGFGDKVKKAGMVVGGIVAAPVALAAYGVKEAYDRLKGDKEEKEEHVHVVEQPEEARYHEEHQEVEESPRQRSSMAESDASMTRSHEQESFARSQMESPEAEAAQSSAYSLETEEVHHHEAPQVEAEHQGRILPATDEELRYEYEQYHPYSDSPARQEQISYEPTEFDAEEQAVHEHDEHQLPVHDAQHEEVQQQKVEHAESPIDKAPSGDEANVPEAQLGDEQPQMVDEELRYEYEQYHHYEPESPQQFKEEHAGASEDEHRVEPEKTEVGEEHHHEEYEEVLSPGEELERTQELETVRPASPAQEEEHPQQVVDDELRYEYEQYHPYPEADQASQQAEHYLEEYSPRREDIPIIRQRSPTPEEPELPEDTASVKSLSSQVGIQEEEQASEAQPVAGTEQPEEVVYLKEVVEEPVDQEVPEESASVKSLNSQVEDVEPIVEHEETSHTFEQPEEIVYLKEVEAEVEEQPASPQSVMDSEEEAHEAPTSQETRKPSAPEFEADFETSKGEVPDSEAGKHHEQEPEGDYEYQEPEPDATSPIPSGEEKRNEASEQDQTPSEVYSEEHRRESNTSERFAVHPEVAEAAAEAEFPASPRSSLAGEEHHVQSAEYEREVPSEVDAEHVEHRELHEETPASPATETERKSSAYEEDEDIQASPAIEVTQFEEEKSKEYYVDPEVPDFGPYGEPVDGYPATERSAQVAPHQEAHEIAEAHPELDEHADEPLPEAHPAESVPQTPTSPFEADRSSPIVESQGNFVEKETYPDEHYEYETYRPPTGGYEAQAQEHQQPETPLSERSVQGSHHDTKRSSIAEASEKLVAEVLDDAEAEAIEESYQEREYRDHEEPPQEQFEGVPARRKSEVQHESFDESRDAEQQQYQHDVIHESPEVEAFEEHGHEVPASPKEGQEPRFETEDVMERESQRSGSLEEVHQEEETRQQTPARSSIAESPIQSEHEVVPEHLQLGEREHEVEQPQPTPSESGLEPAETAARGDSPVTQRHEAAYDHHEEPTFVQESALQEAHDVHPEHFEAQLAQSQVEKAVLEAQPPSYEESERLEDVASAPTTPRSTDLHAMEESKYQTYEDLSRTSDEEGEREDADAIEQEGKPPTYEESEATHDTEPVQVRVEAVEPEPESQFEEEDRNFGAETRTPPASPVPEYDAPVIESEEYQLEQYQPEAEADFERAISPADSYEMAKQAREADEQRGQESPKSTDSRVEFEADVKAEVHSTAGSPISQGDAAERVEVGDQVYQRPTSPADSFEMEEEQRELGKQSDEESPRSTDSRVEYGVEEEHQREELASRSPEVAGFEVQEHEDAPSPAAAQKPHIEHEHRHVVESEEYQFEHEAKHETTESPSHHQERSIEETRPRLHRPDSLDVEPLEVQEERDVGELLREHEPPTTPSVEEVSMPGEEAAVIESHGYDAGLDEESHPESPESEADLGGHAEEGRSPSVDEHHREVHEAAPASPLAGSPKPEEQLYHVEQERRIGFDHVQEESERFEESHLTDTHVNEHHLRQEREAGVEEHQERPESPVESDKPSVLHEEEHHLRQEREVGFEEHQQRPEFLADSDNHSQRHEEPQLESPATSGPQSRTSGRAESIESPAQRTSRPDSGSEFRQEFDSEQYQLEHPEEAKYHQHEMEPESSGQTQEREDAFDEAQHYEKPTEVHGQHLRHESVGGFVVSEERPDEAERQSSRVSEDYPEAGSRKDSHTSQPAGYFAESPIIHSDEYRVDDDVQAVAEDQPYSESPRRESISALSEEEKASSPQPFEHHEHVEHTPESARISHEEQIVESEQAQSPGDGYIIPSDDYEAYEERTQSPVTTLHEIREESMEEHDEAHFDEPARPSIPLSESPEELEKIELHSSPKTEGYAHFIEEKPLAQEVQEQEERVEHSVPETKDPEFYQEQATHKPDSESEGEELEHREGEAFIGEYKSEKKGLGSKVLGFAKKAGMVAGGVVAAPVALAAYGVKGAVESLQRRGSKGEYQAVATEDPEYLVHSESYSPAEEERTNFEREDLAEETAGRQYSDETFEEEHRKVEEQEPTQEQARLEPMQEETATIRASEKPHVIQSESYEHEEQFEAPKDEYVIHTEEHHQEADQHPEDSFEQVEAEREEKPASPAVEDHQNSHLIQSDEYELVEGQPEEQHLDVDEYEIVHSPEEREDVPPASPGKQSEHASSPEDDHRAIAGDEEAEIDEISLRLAVEAVGQAAHQLSEQMTLEVTPRSPTVTDRSNVDSENISMDQRGIEEEEKSSFEEHQQSPTAPSSTERSVIESEAYRGRDYETEEPESQEGTYRDTEARYESDEKVLQHEETPTTPPSTDRDRFGDYVTEEQTHRDSEVKVTEEQATPSTPSSAVIESESYDRPEEPPQDDEDDEYDAVSPVPSSARSQKQLLKQESWYEKAVEPEVDYQSDLQEKLDILAAQNREELPGPDEEDNIREEDDRTIPSEESLNRMASDMVRNVLETVEEETHQHSDEYGDYQMIGHPGVHTLRTTIDIISDSARTTPDVALRYGDDREETPPSANASGMLYIPEADPGRPVSPIPPTRTDSGLLIGLKQPEDTIVFEQCMTPDILEQPSSVNPLLKKAMVESIQLKGLEIPKKVEATFEEKEQQQQLESPKQEERYQWSSESLDHGSVKSHGSSAGKRYSTSRRSSGELSSQPADASPHERRDFGEEPEHIAREVVETEEYQVVETIEDPSEEGFDYPHDEPVDPELETVEEEPEDNDSLNGSGSSSAGQPVSLASLARYKHTSSDNVSESSLQEFERIEKMVKGEGSLTGSDIELATGGNGALLKSGQGSLSSLAEFERIEAEIAKEAPEQDEAMMLSDIREESEAEDMSVRDTDDEDHDQHTDLRVVPIREEPEDRADTPTGVSPADSIEHVHLEAEGPTVDARIMEASTDSLEPSGRPVQIVEPRMLESMEETSLDEYEVIERMEVSTHDSLENLPHDRDSLLEGASQEVVTSQEAPGLSGDTVGTYQEHTDEDKDSLAGDMDNVVSSYSKTLTIFETTQTKPDGTVERISRRVETRVEDPVTDHVTFTGTEGPEQVSRVLEGGSGRVETVDSQGNVTTTTVSRSPPQPRH